MCLIPLSLSESQVLISVDQFIQEIYRTEINETLFKNSLNDLVPKFKEIYKPYLKYSESIYVFNRMVCFLDKILIGNKSIDNLNSFE